MAREMWRKQTPEGPRYRVWYTVADVWECDEMTRDQAVAYDPERGAGWVDRCDADPERHTDEWWLTCMEADCAASGYHLDAWGGKPSRPQVGQCAWCGAVLEVE